jgi:putative sigma-54 modulation protein
LYDGGPFCGGGHPFTAEGESPVQISISARHGDLSAATQEKINEKAAKLTRYFDRVTSIQVTVDLEHREAPLVEVCVSAEHAEDFVATDSSSNVLAAFDGAVHKIERQLRKHKEKLTGRHPTSHKHLETPAEPESEP